MFLFSDEALFHLSRYVNSKNNGQLSAQNPTLIYDMELHNVTLVCCVL